MVNTLPLNVQSTVVLYITITKVFFSIVLLAICDAHYIFSLVNIGDYGSNNDSGVLENSVVGKAFAIACSARFFGGISRVLPPFWIRCRQGELGRE